MYCTVLVPCIFTVSENILSLCTVHIHGIHGIQIKGFTPGVRVPFLQLDFWVGIYSVRYRISECLENTDLAAIQSKKISYVLR